MRVQYGDECRGGERLTRQTSSTINSDREGEPFLKKLPVLTSHRSCMQSFTLRTLLCYIGPQYSHQTHSRPNPFLLHSLSWVLLPHAYFNVNSRPSTFGLREFQQSPPPSSSSPQIFMMIPLAIVPASHRSLLRRCSPSSQRPWHHQQASAVDVR